MPHRFDQRSIWGIDLVPQNDGGIICPPPDGGILRPLSSARVNPAFAGGGGR